MGIIKRSSTSLQLLLLVTAVVVSMMYNSLLYVCPLSFENTRAIHCHCCMYICFVMYDAMFIATAA